METKPRSRKPNTALELKLFDALKRIAAYEPPERLMRNSERDYGVRGSEAVEMAYENVIEEAKRATRGLRVNRPTT